MFTDNAIDLHVVIEIHAVEQDAFHLSTMIDDQPLPITVPLSMCSSWPVGMEPMMLLPSSRAPFSMVVLSATMTLP